MKRKPIKAWGISGYLNDFSSGVLRRGEYVPLVKFEMDHSGCNEYAIFETRAMARKYAERGDRKYYKLSVVSVLVTSN